MGFRIWSKNRAFVCIVLGVPLEQNLLILDKFADTKISSNSDKYIDMLKEVFKHVQANLGISENVFSGTLNSGDWDYGTIILGIWYQSAVWFIRQENRQIRRQYERLVCPPSSRTQRY